MTKKGKRKLIFYDESDFNAYLEKLKKSHLLNEADVTYLARHGAIQRISHAGNGNEKTIIVDKGLIDKYLLFRGISKDDIENQDIV
ncbi:hypothetical protein ES703_76069 [subsurface metagenome]